MKQIKFETVQELRAKLKPGHLINTVRHDTMIGKNENGETLFGSKDEGNRQIKYVNKIAFGIFNQFSTTDLTTWLNWPKPHEAMIIDSKINYYNRQLTLFGNVPIITTYKFYEET